MGWLCPAVRLPNQRSNLTSVRLPTIITIQNSNRSYSLQNPQRTPFNPCTSSPPPPHTLAFLGTASAGCRHHNAGEENLGTEDGGASETAEVADLRAAREDLGEGDRRRGQGGLTR